METPERCDLFKVNKNNNDVIDVFIVKYEHILLVFMALPLLPLNK